MLETNKNFIFVIQSDEGPYPCQYLDPCKDNWDLKTSNINVFYASNKLKRISFTKSVKSIKTQSNCSLAFCVASYLVCQMS